MPGVWGVEENKAAGGDRLKISVCDICKESIKWPKIKIFRYKVRYDGCFSFRQKIEMCEDCNKQLMEYLEACAAERKYKNSLHSHIVPQSKIITPPPKKKGT